MPQNPARRDDHDDTPIRSRSTEERRRAESRRRMFLYSGIGGGIILAAVVVVVLLVSGSGRRIADGRPRDPLGVNPRPNVEGVEWSHEQMVAYLGRRGVQLETKWFVLGVAMEIKERNAFSTTPPGVIVWKKDSPQAAQAYVAENPGAFSWGRYYFDGGAGYMRQEIATLLGVMYP